MPAVGLGAQEVIRRINLGKFGILLTEVQHRFIHHALRVSQGKLGAFVECGLQGFFGLRAAIVEHHGLKVGFEGVAVGFSAGHQGGIKAPPHQRLGRCIVFEQFVIGRQFHLLQDSQRRRAQQRRKPAVESANLHLASIVQNALV